MIEHNSETPPVTLNKKTEYRGRFKGDMSKERGASSSDVRRIVKRQERARVQISLKLSAANNTLSINGQSAELQNEEHNQLAWNVIRAALFKKYPSYEIQRLLRSAR